MRASHENAGKRRVSKRSPALPCPALALRHKGLAPNNVVGPLTRCWATTWKRAGNEIAGKRRISERSPALPCPALPCPAPQ
ncbi:hypothetical protein NtRootA1_36810 [Arthrobacter sp. NtRootA1]|nr:hypothetical protein NtRootA1_36810 [Arthrobacter sp. NtRootA1]